MKSIFLSVVVISAILVAGVGGTLATWSDSETSMDNYIETGSVDLMVNGADDLPYGEGVPTKVEISCMIPCKVYGPYEVELWNAGQCEFASHAYIHVKNAECSNIPAKENSGYACPETGIISPEPELVAQYGGKVNCVEVPGVGRVGDECSMRSHVRMWVTDNPDLVPDIDIPFPDTRFIIDNKIINIVCTETYLFDLEPCVPRTIFIYFHLQQESEEDYDLNLIPNPGEAGYDEMEYKKFNDWPSWALMKDRLDFDMEFDLWLEDP